MHSAFSDSSLVTSKNLHHTELSERLSFALPGESHFSHLVLCRRLVYNLQINNVIYLTSVNAQVLIC